MQIFFIKIIRQLPLKIDLKVEEMRSAPTHFTNVFHYQEELIKVEYSPGSKEFDELQFRKLMLKSAKRQFKGKIVDARILDSNPLIG